MTVYRRPLCSRVRKILIFCKSERKKSWATSMIRPSVSVTVLLFKKESGVPGDTSSFSATSPEATTADILS